MIKRNKLKKTLVFTLIAGMLAGSFSIPVFSASKGWKLDAKGWWYQYENGAYPVNKWEKINQNWYYFDEQGYMKANSWIFGQDEKWYYVGASGAMKVNSWICDNQKWYYLDSDGSMFEGGWILVGNQWYFMDNQGVMQTGVIKVGLSIYYLGGENDGAMKTGKATIDGKEYEFQSKNGWCISASKPEPNQSFDKYGEPYVRKDNDNYFLLLNAECNEDRTKVMLSFTRYCYKIRGIQILDENGQNVPYVSADSPDGRSDAMEIEFETPLNANEKYTVVIPNGKDGTVLTDDLLEWENSVLQNNRITFTTAATKLDVSYDETTKLITCKINGKQGEKEDLILFNGQTPGNWKLLSADDDIDANELFPDKNITKIKCYYNGEVQEVVLTDRLNGAKVEQRRLDRLTKNDFKGVLQEAHRTFDNRYLCFCCSNQLKDFKVTKIVIQQDDGFFDGNIYDITPGEIYSLESTLPDGSLNLKFGAFPEIPNMTATITVTYASKYYPEEVSREITFQYKTLDFDNDGSVDGYTYSAIGLD